MSTSSPSLAAGPLQCVWDAGRVLGEGAWWSVEEQSLYWVDIKDPAILRLDPVTGARNIWPMPESIGCCAPVASGGLIAGLASGLAAIELGEAGAPARITPMLRPNGHEEGDRFNDGKCHPDGSFWAGTMDDAEGAVRGLFYRYSGGETVEMVAGPYLVCNGPAFSPDGRFAYLADSAARIVHRIDLNSDVSRTPHPFIQFGEKDGYPDGMTTDDQGRLWIAFWDGARVGCYAPDDGRMLLDIPMPLPRPTSCAFGGPDLATLYVTSAHTPDDRAGRDEGGALYAIPIVGARGWPTPSFTAKEH